MNKKVNENALSPHSRGMKVSRYCSQLLVGEVAVMETHLALTAGIRNEYNIQYNSNSDNTHTAKTIVYTGSGRLKVCTKCVLALVNPLKTELLLINY